MTSEAGQASAQPGGKGGGRVMHELATYCTNLIFQSIPATDSPYAGVVWVEFVCGYRLFAYYRKKS